MKTRDGLLEKYIRNKRCRERKSNARPGPPPTKRYVTLEPSCHNVTTL